MFDIDSVTGAWDPATLPASIRTGRDCYLEARHCFSRLLSRTEPALILGDRVEIYTWTTFNLEPGAQVEIGSDSVLVGAVLMCAERITIGRRVVVSYNVTLADCDFHPRDPMARRRDAVATAPNGDRSQRPPLESRPVRIDDDVHIGIGAIVLKGVHVGAGAVIGAGAVVTRDVSAGTRVGGNPAIPLPQAPG